MPDGQKSLFTYAATMDIEIIHDLFTNCIEAIDVLAADAPDGKFDAEFRAELAAALDAACRRCRSASAPARCRSGSRTTTSPSRSTGTFRTCSDCTPAG